VIAFVWEDFLGQQSTVGKSCTSNVLHVYVNEYDLNECIAFEFV
jgi:hypothetical protein